MSGQGRPVPELVDGSGLSVALVATRWHQDLTELLAERAAAALLACGVTEVLSERVAGAVELPVVVQQLASSVDAVVALGVVIRGGTPHFEYVCDAVTAGLTRVSLDERTPVGNGVLTCDTLAQAWDRAGGPEAAEDKGFDAAVAAVDTAMVLRRLRNPVLLNKAPADQPGLLNRTGP
jgi:6,7-dimethyl-8-ribityllumazine synthase